MGYLPPTKRRSADRWVESEGKVALVVDTRRPNNNGGRLRVSELRMSWVGEVTH